MPGAEQNEQPINQTGTGEQQQVGQEVAGAAPQTAGEDDLGDFADPKKALAEIKKLRSENAERRTKAKDFETKFNAMQAKFERLQQFFGNEGQEEIDPEEHIAQLYGALETTEVEASVNQLARIYNVPIEHDDYFRFLLNQRFATMEEGEEIGEEDFEAIINKVQALGGVQKNVSTGVGAKAPNPGEQGSVTVEDFKKMNTLEKSDLYTKNPTLYAKLSAEAMMRR